MATKLEKVKAAHEECLTCLQELSGELYVKDQTLAAASAFIEHVRAGGECETRWKTVDAHLDVCKSCKLLNDFDVKAATPTS